MSVKPSAELGLLEQIHLESWAGSSASLRNRLLLIALTIVVLFHGGLLFTGSFTETYDAYIHMFMGDHYARDWFSTWDQRWYTGFTTVSYPPGTHMAIAALSFLVGDLRIAFAIVMLAGLVLLTIGVYRFSRLWVSENAAGVAAIILATSSGVSETVHLFGQLPTIWSLALLLNASWFVADFMRNGRFRSLGLATIALAACTAGHHVTTLFGAIFFLGPIIAYILLKTSRPAVPQNGSFIALMAARLSRAVPYLWRTGLLGICTLGVLIAVVLPYWIWSATDPIAQIPIPHGTRENFIARPNLGLIFFVIPWGLLVVAIPTATIKYLRQRHWPIAASMLLAFLLGTGGTTPLPRALLRGAFDILTLDRFTFWATILILPAAGQVAVDLAARLTEERAGLRHRLKRTAAAGFIVAHLALAVFSATLTQYRPFQPAAIDMAPIADFLEKDQHERWRYLTLGFGDQMAWLSTQTEATQVDGNYHSARRLPELISTPIERLEGAKYTGIEGLGSLQQFLTVPEKYHLKFIFSNDRFYDPLLNSLGWKDLGPLENGIYLWERADIEPLPSPLPVTEIPDWQRYAWGLLPPASTVAGLVLIALSLAGVVKSKRVPLDPRPIRWLEQSLNEWSKPQLSDAAKDEFDPWPRLDALWRRTRWWLYGALVIAAGAAAIVALKPVPETPENVVAEYYDHLDFRRFTEAYELLNPETRPDFELWRLQLSRRGGLIASYATLDSVALETVAQRQDTATVVADQLYLTSVKYIEASDELELSKVADRWHIEPPIVDVATTPDQLVRTPKIDFFEQGRRQVTSGTTDLGDIQDRPNLAVSNLYLNTVNDRPRLVGFVRNIDVDPADLTMTGVIRDTDGELIAQYNAGGNALNTILPGETTPFVVDFEEVGANGTDDFDPFTFEPLTITELDDVIVELYAKAVVTADRVEKSLSITDVKIEDNLVSGELFNSGTNSSLVPRLLITYLDGDRIVGIENHFVDQAVMPQRIGEFEISLNEIEVEQLNPDIGLSINGAAETQDVVRDTSALILPVNAQGYDQIRIDVSSYWSEQ